jgi:hypothetical protein
LDETRLGDRALRAGHRTRRPSSQTP